MILTGAGLCNMYMINDKREGREAWSVAHSVSCEIIDKDPRKNQLRNNNKRRIR